MSRNSAALMGMLLAVEEHGLPTSYHRDFQKHDREAILNGAYAEGPFGWTLHEYGTHLFRDPSVAKMLTATVTGERVVLYVWDGVGLRCFRNAQAQAEALEDAVAHWFLEQAVARVRNGGDPQAWQWVFFHTMTKTERHGFDQMLVRTGHPSASEPGTTEQRFRQLVRERTGG